ncbi:hypothetical protein ACFL6Y_02725 [Elusimicrobiota bacterium]
MPKSKLTILMFTLTIFPILAFCAETRDMDKLNATFDLENIKQKTNTKPVQADAEPKNFSDINIKTIKGFGSKRSGRIHLPIPPHETEISNFKADAYSGAAGIGSAGITAVALKRLWPSIAKMPVSRSIMPAPMAGLTRFIRIAGISVIAGLAAAYMVKKSYPENTQQ